MNRLFDEWNAVERQTAKRLAEIEVSDASRCASCGGEDCVCCEIYQDRQKWQSPQDFFDYCYY